MPAQSASTQEAQLLSGNIANTFNSTAQQTGQAPPTATYQQASTSPFLPPVNHWANPFTHYASQTYPIHPASQARVGQALTAAQSSRPESAFGGQHVGRQSSGYFGSVNMGSGRISAMTGANNRSTTAPPTSLSGTKNQQSILRKRSIKDVDEEEAVSGLSSPQLPRRQSSRQRASALASQSNNKDSRLAAPSNVSSMHTTQSTSSLLSNAVNLEQDSKDIALVLNSTQEAKDIAERRVQMNLEDDDIAEVDQPEEVRDCIRKLIRAVFYNTPLQPSVLHNENGISAEYRRLSRVDTFIEYWDDWQKNAEKQVSTVLNGQNPGWKQAGRTEIHKEVEAKARLLIEALIEAHRRGYRPCSVVPDTTSTCSKRINDATQLIAGYNIIKFDFLTEKMDFDDLATNPTEYLLKKYANLRNNYRRDVLKPEASDKKDSDSNDSAGDPSLAADGDAEGVEDDGQQGGFSQLSTPLNKRHKVAQSGQPSKPSTTKNGRKKSAPRSRRGATSADQSTTFVVPQLPGASDMGDTHTDDSLSASGGNMDSPDIAGVGRAAASPE